MDFFAIILGLFFLIKGGEYLFDGSLAISIKLKIPKFIIGMTIVSFATSAPELVVSVKSALMGYPDLALGNIVGSNIANIAFVMGIVVLLSPIEIDKVFYKFDWPIMMLITLLFYFLLKTGNFLSLEEGIIMIAVLIIYLFVILFFQKSKDSTESQLPLEPGVKGTTNSHSCLLAPAKKTALMHEWNPDSKAPEQQIGFVVIEFKLAE